MIQGKQREVKEFGRLKVGLFIGKVVCVNPNEEEYKNILGITLNEGSKATEYLGESKEGNTTLRINFWLEDIKTKQKYPVTFFLENKVKENKDATKKQYINAVGSCSWADDPNNLPDWFKSRDYREAFVGEEDLYTFMRTWLGTLDFRDAETTFQMDWKKFMKGNVSEIKAQIGGEFCTNVVALATVKTVAKEGEESKEYQGVFNKAFLPEYALKNFRLVDYSKPEVQASIKAKKPKDQKPHEKFVLSVVGEYGCKDFYVLKDLKDYDPADNVVASSATILEDNDAY